MIESVQTTMLHACMGALGCMALVVLASSVRQHLRRFLNCFIGKGRIDTTLALIAICGMVAYGSTKPTPPPVDPEPDPDDPIVTQQVCTVTFDANGGVGGWSKELEVGASLSAPAVTRDGYKFIDWEPEVPVAVPVSNATYVAQWEKIPDPDVDPDPDPDPGPDPVPEPEPSPDPDPGPDPVPQPDPDPDPVPRPEPEPIPDPDLGPQPGPGPDPSPEPAPEPAPKEVHVLYKAVDGTVPTVAASEYNGYLVDAKGAEKGSIQVKIGKPNANTGLAAVKATVVIGTKKVMLKGVDKGKAVIATDGPTELALAGGEACEITLGAEALSGVYGAYVIDGARNLFTSKNKAEVSAANAVLAKWLGSVMVFWDGGSLSISIAAKGKVKVSGTLANGKTKVSANSTFLIGEEWSCVPVVAQKANLAFVLWLSPDGGMAAVDGLGDGVLVGRTGMLADGAMFQIVDDNEFLSVLGQDILPFLPDGVVVTQKGTKWILPRAGKITMKKGWVDDLKAGDNPCGLKLAYKAKDGSFKGSFKVYAGVNGKLKTTTVNVTGFLLNGIGYGTATVKGKGSVDVTIKP